MKRSNAKIRGITLAAAALASQGALAGTGEQSFTPVSLIVPITSITMTSTSGDQAELFSCKGDSCAVDLADSAAVTALFEGKSGNAKAGDYNKIQLSNCGDSDGYDVKVKGTFQINSTTYYTTAGSTPLSTNSADYDYATISFTGCQSSYDLRETVTIKDGDSLELKLFVTLENLAWGQTASASSMGGCKSGGNMSVCAGYPAPVPYIGDSAPTLESYLIAEDHDSNGATTADLTKAHGQLLLFLDSTGEPMGGIAHRYYSPDSQNGKNFDCPIQTVQKNSGASTYFIETYGSTGSVDVGYFEIPAFTRLNASGDTQSGSYQKGDGSEIVNIMAKRL